MTFDVNFEEREMALSFGGASTSHFDADGDGVVDNAARLGGYAPEHFASREELASLRVREISLREDGALVFVLADGSRFVTPSVTGAQGPAGPQGERGERGERGESGYTPIRGVDYFTEADLAEITRRVLAELGESGGNTGNTPEKGEAILSLNEEEISIGTDGAFLEIGKGYFVEDTYFVAVVGGDNDYPAPPLGLVITNGHNTGKVEYDGSGWYVGWESGPLSEYSVTFYRVVGETYRGITDEGGDDENEGGGNGDERDDIVAVLSEEELASGTDGAFLEIGKAYYANSAYFVAEVSGGDDYPAPPYDMVIETDGNRGTVCHDGSSWCVIWENAPSADRTVIFYKAGMSQ